MKVLIDIPEELKRIADTGKTKKFSSLMWNEILMDSIKNGAVLPEQYGRLIDADAFKEELERYWEKRKGICFADISYIIDISVPTILRATK